ncbi:MAG: type II secretion system protein, partial [Planctomycetota bacterium]
MQAGACVRGGFTLIELLVVIAIVTLLVGILLPTLGSARQVARAAADLSNVRQLQTAHWVYMTDYDGWFIDVGLGHGSSHADEEVAWIKTLNDHYSAAQNSGLGQEIAARSPLDDSPHWGPAPQGEPIPGAPADQRRRTSYGMNNWL